MQGVMVSEGGAPAFFQPGRPESNHLGFCRPGCPTLTMTLYAGRHGERGRGPGAFSSRGDPSRTISVSHGGYTTVATSSVAGPIFANALSHSPARSSQRGF